MTIPKLHPYLPWLAAAVLILGMFVVARWDQYLADSMCWSAIGFLLGYFVCRLESQLRELVEEHRDHS